MAAARPSSASAKKSSFGSSSRPPPFPLALLLVAAASAGRPAAAFSPAARPGVPVPGGARSLFRADRHSFADPSDRVPPTSSSAAPLGGSSYRSGSFFNNLEAIASCRRPRIVCTMAAAEGVYSDVAPSDVGVAASPAASLASSYVIHASEGEGEGEGENGGEKTATKEFVWSLYPIDDDGLAGCVGAAAVRALRTPPSPEEDGAAARVLRCRVERTGGESGGTTIIAVTEETGASDGDGADSDADADLISVLGKVLVQWAAARSSLPTGDDNYPSAAAEVTVALPGGAADLNLSAEDVLGDRPVALFGLAGDDDDEKEEVKIEMSEMVDSAGERLGVVPRTLVHKFNLLHRGIGIVVSRDEHIRPRRGSAAAATSSTSPDVSTPDVYCHRRTETKRIFPSMYDMFVGGVSTAGERPALTAAREVAEEYGLTRALRYLDEGGVTGDAKGGEGEAPLSAPLFKRTVCTSYNRCVVTVFTYRFRTDLEEARWQEEEVAWGDFVPYRVVERAARLDIDRLKEEGEWPGTGYREVPVLEGDETEGEVSGDYGNGEWKKWRFVPDGLLVWEAWVAWRDGGFGSADR